MPGKVALLVVLLAGCSSASSTPAAQPSETADSGGPGRSENDASSSSSLPTTGSDSGGPGRSENDASSSSSPMPGSDSGGSGTDASESADGVACLPAGTVCTSTPNACCSGVCSEPTTTSGQAVCAAPCSSGSDCASGCCAPVTGATGTYCSPIGFCPNLCMQAGSACQADTDCCRGETCVTTNGGSCAANCTANTDCMSGCCAPLNNSSVSVCSAPQFCGQPGH